MLMETDDARYDAEAMALASKSDPKIRDWEELMWKFQAATPWTPVGARREALPGAAYFCACASSARNASIGGLTNALACSANSFTGAHLCPRPSRDKS